PALDHLPRPPAQERPQAPLQELEPEAAAESPVLAILRVDISLAALEVREPRADPRGLLRVAGMRMGGVCRLHHLERAPDVLAVQLEAHDLEERLGIARVRVSRERPVAAHTSSGPRSAGAPPDRIAAFGPSSN